MWLGNLIAGIVVLALGVAVVFFSSQLAYLTEYGPGPGFLPLWLGIALTGCSIGIIIKTVLKADSLRPGGVYDPEGKGLFFKPRTKTGLKMLVLIVVTFLLFPLLGFSVGLAFFTTLSMRAIGKHRLILCGLAGISTAIGIHFLFGRWLDIPLPTGIIGW